MMHQVWFMLLAAASATRLESFNAGLRASQKGDADAALSHFQAAVKADGDLGKDDVSLHLALGEALSRAGAHAEAAQHLQQALDLCHEHELGDKVRGPPRPRQPANSITLSCTPRDHGTPACAQGVRCGGVQPRGRRRGRGRRAGG